MLQFLNEIPVYLFDREQVTFVALSQSEAVNCRVTKAAILLHAGLEDAGPTQLLHALMCDRGHFEMIAQEIHARNGGAFVLIDARDINGSSSAAA